ncbi:protein BIG GRAIN 1-like E [Senna tora]|uniref:Protein BIG GRAIN 1-like E n=1 Tax=Senna tora TaxID=362788 RepID=A0A834SST4_9FABA|nr:protein BIG GRAIN 1-like E [Senna tora]
MVNQEEYYRVLTFSAIHSSKPACTMSSIAGGIIDSEKNYKKSYHYRNDSGELDVFEAARYFSGYNEVVGYNNNVSSFTQKIMREERHGHRGRISLDMPMRSLLPQQFHGVEKKEKKHKQPSSPGGRLASFLNSLFSQSASKKKKSKSSTQAMKDHEDHESPANGRRWRRSSISHFRSSSTTSDSKSLYSSFSSGFRTPPYNVQTPTKSCKEFRTFSDHKQQQQQAVQSISKHNNNKGLVKSTSLQNELWNDQKKKREPSFLDESCKCRNGMSEKDRMWVEKYSPAEEEDQKEFRKFNSEVDDGAESDSSSDLFELQNYDLGYYPSGLPVYETTNMDNIKRGAPISNGPL